MSNMNSTDAYFQRRIAASKSLTAAASKRKEQNDLYDRAQLQLLTQQYAPIGVLARKLASEPVIEKNEDNNIPDSFKVVAGEDDSEDEIDDYESPYRAPSFKGGPMFYTPTQEFRDKEELLSEVLVSAKLRNLDRTVDAVMKAEEILFSPNKRSLSYEMRNIAANAVSEIEADKKLAKSPSGKELIAQLRDKLKQ